MDWVARGGVVPENIQKPKKDFQSKQAKGGTGTTTDVRVHTCTAISTNPVCKWKQTCLFNFVNHLLSTRCQCCSIYSIWRRAKNKFCLVYPTIGRKTKQFVSGRMQMMMEYYATAVLSNNNTTPILSQCHLGTECGWREGFVTAWARTLQWLMLGDWPKWSGRWFPAVSSRTNEDADLLSIAFHVCNLYNRASLRCTPF